MSCPDFGRPRHAWRYLMLLVASSLLSCSERPVVLGVEAPLKADTVRYAVEPGQRVDFAFELSVVTPLQRERDLLLDFDADVAAGKAGGTVILENFFAVSTPPTVRLKDNRIIASGEVIAVANAERKDPLAEMLEQLEAPAAGGNIISAGIPLFSYLGSSLADRLREHYSAGDDAGSSETGGKDASVGNKASPLKRIRFALSIIHAANELGILEDYRHRVTKLQDDVIRRMEAGVARRSEADLIAAWVLNAEQRQAQFRTALDIALDDFENGVGVRPPAYTGYPAAWDAQMPGSLDVLLQELPEKDRASARQSWRLASLEAGNLKLLHRLQEVMQRFHDAAEKQFQIGLRTLSDLLTSEKGLFENAIVTNDARYRLYLAQAQLYAAMDQLPDPDPAAWQASGGVE